MKSKKEGKAENYDFDRQVEPIRRMGQGNFANLPNEPIYMKLQPTRDYRSGVINRFESSVEDMSGIYENDC